MNEITMVHIAFVSVGSLSSTSVALYEMTVAKMNPFSLEGVSLHLHCIDIYRRKHF